MRAVLQRVRSASVSVDNTEVGRCRTGYLILLGVAPQDSEETARLLWDKISHLRVFADKAGHMNLSLIDVAGEVLVVSQFTLFANCRRGRRPSFSGAAEPSRARALYERFCSLAEADVTHVGHGIFGAHMEVSLINDGPVTICLDTDELTAPRHR